MTEEIDGKKVFEAIKDTRGTQGVQHEIVFKDKAELDKVIKAMNDSQDFYLKVGDTVTFIRYNHISFLEYEGKLVLKAQYKSEGGK